LVFVIIFLLMAFLLERNGDLVGLSSPTSAVLWYSISAIGVILNIISARLDIRRALLCVPILAIYVIGNVPELLPLGDVGFFLWLLLGLWPITALLVGSLLGTFLAVRGYRRRPVEMACLLLLAATQLPILTAWWFGMTSASYYMQPSFELSAGHVIDPGIEATVMKTVWAVSVTSLMVVIACPIWCAIERKPRQETKRRLVRVLAICVLVLVLLGMYVNDCNHMRMGRSLAETMSPNGSRAVLLVPMSGLVEIYGVCLWREPGKFWWRPVGRIRSEVLTQTRAPTFVWDNGSQHVRLLCDEWGWFEADFPGRDDQPSWRWQEDSRLP
jgi:hypothetical protein